MPVGIVLVRLAIPPVATCSGQAWADVRSTEEPPTPRAQNVENLSRPKARACTWPAAPPDKGRERRRRRRSGQHVGRGDERHPHGHLSVVFARPWVSPGDFVVRGMVELDADLVGLVVRARPDAECVLWPPGRG